MLKVFAIYDRKAHTYGQPYFAVNDSVALRMFEGVCKNPASTVRLFPDDYSLFELGTYDELEGKIENLERAKLLGVAVQFTESEDLRLAREDATADEIHANLKEMRRPFTDGPKEVKKNE